MISPGMELCDVLDGPGWSDCDFSPERGGADLAGTHWGKLLGRLKLEERCLTGIYGISHAVYIYILYLYNIYYDICILCI